jgi:hypothetical protein
MFDAATAELIRAAPAISGVDPLTLPQELTRAYSELVVLRLKGTALVDDPDQLQSLQRLKRIADIYEAAVDSGTTGNARRAAPLLPRLRINCSDASCRPATAGIKRSWSLMLSIRLLRPHSFSWWRSRMPTHGKPRGR